MSERVGWGVDSEYGRLRDVLLCSPEHFRWGATSAISRATLASDLEFDPARAARQHAEMVAAYEEAGVACHFIEADPDLPYQVFARDSSLVTPWGAVIMRLRQDWRHNEDGPAARFYEKHGIPIVERITAGALEGGDVMILEPGLVLIGHGERSDVAGARQLAAFFEREGWRTRIEPTPEGYVHTDVVLAVLDRKLAAVSAELISPALASWLRETGFELIELSASDAFGLGVNAISLGSGRVLSASAAKPLNEAMRSHGLEVLDPELEMFTLGGGGAHCLGLALRREGAG